MNKNLLKIGLSIFAIILGFFLLVQPLNKNNSIEEKEPNLTTEERLLIENRLQEVQKKLFEATTENEKFNAQMQIGFQQYGLGQYKEAKETFLKAADLEPDNYVVYVALYQVELDRQDNQSARKNIKKALALKEENPDLWRKYIQLETDRFFANDDQLKDLYLEALTRTNSHVDMLAFYAQFLEKSNDLKSALDIWKKAYEQIPDPLYQEEIERLEALLKL